MDIQDTLNKEQREAVLHLKGPLLILAGAGSGKTRVLTHRIAYMIEEKGVNPWNIMAITFTNKAAGEMRERIDKMVGFGSESIWVSTFHSSCVRILRRYIERIGFDNHFTIYDMDDQKSVMKDICKRLEIDTKIYKERNLLAAISSAKDEMISPKEFTLNAEGDFGLQKVAKVYTEYQNVLKGNNALDFDDLIIKTVELFLECPDVLESYQNRFSYIMVDEYQDTNTAQFEFIRLLAKRDKNLCVVGDDDQSIYKFRGANIRNILEFESNYPDAKVIKLEQNYRSTQNILDAANEVIKNNRGRKEKALWTNEGRGAPIHFCQFDHGGEEAEYIVEDIRHKTKAGGINYKDCAILYRTNAQSRLLEEQFVLSGIPYRVVGGVNFYARKEIKDLLAYLKTIHNGQDDLAVKRIINVPKRGIGTTTINRIQEYALSKGISFYESLCEADEILSIGKSVGKLKPFVTMIQAFRSKLDYLSLEELMNDIIETTNYVKELEMSDDEDAEDRISNIEEFMSKIVAFESNAEEPPTLGEFLEEISLVADIDNVEEKDDRVLLMTLHSAKGLEFSNVYLTGMEDGIFPSYMTIVSDDPTDMEEARRLCYVGITRAKKALTLTCAKQRMIRGETQYNPISRFIREIPGELLDNLPPSRKMSRQDMEELTIFSQSGRNSAPSSVRQKQAITSRPILSGKPASAENPASIFSRNSIGTGKKAAAVVQGKKTGLTMAETLDYGEGDRVSHMKFGQGTVMQIVKGGRDYEVTVQFDQGGIKKMFATFAKLKKT